MQNKSRILYLLKYLNDNSDETRPISTTELSKHLETQGITSHRTTISADVAMLEEIGIDIITIKSSSNQYFIGSRQFELPELKLLVDAVSSSKFITQKKSIELISKIKMLTSKPIVGAYS